ncbi:MAG: hypothetical protein K8S14_08955, partial [Actinomycetia bacterium]|nr:hypothetical protein [Actinomycetes bacterium]
MARLLPSHISLGVSVVAISEAILPLTFSFTTGRLENAHIKVIRIASGKKYAIKPIINSSIGSAAFWPIHSFLLRTMLTLAAMAIVTTENTILIIRKVFVCLSSLKSLLKIIPVFFK